MDAQDRVKQFSCKYYVYETFLTLMPSLTGEWFRNPGAGPRRW